MNIIVIMDFLLTLFFYFFYMAEAPNLSYTIVLLVIYCVQSVKCQKFVLMLRALHVKKMSFVMSYFHALRCLTLQISRELYFIAGFNPMDCLAIFQLTRPSNGK